MKKLALICLSLSFAACGSKDRTLNRINEVAGNNATRVALVFDGKKLNSACDDTCAPEAALARDFQMTGIIDLQRTKQVLLNIHAETYNRIRVKGSDKTDEKSLETNLIEKLAKLSKSGDPLLLKSEYELGLGKIVYNRAATTLGHIEKRSKLQCYSGTTLYLLTALEALGAAGFDNGTLVVILENGHIMPGIIRLEAGRFRLIGIETTSIGKSQKDFGFTDKLQTIGRPLRVIRADQFLLIEATRELVTNKREAVNSALGITAKQFRIALPELEKMVSAQSAIDSTAAGSTKMLNSSIFGFGVSKSAEGDRALTPLEFAQIARPEGTSDYLPSEPTILSGAQSVGVNLTDVNGSSLTDTILAQENLDDVILTAASEHFSIASTFAKDYLGCEPKNPNLITTMPANIAVSITRETTTIQMAIGVEKANCRSVPADKVMDGLVTAKFNFVQQAGNMYVATADGKHLVLNITSIRDFYQESLSPTQVSKVYNLQIIDGANSQNLIAAWLMRVPTID